jgi:alkanesulfonate monooxygenase SsuD/methylene tetrahydromethanopterin reductase-like flavin-dependent oxidoreductase (luciferase family)
VNVPNFGPGTNPEVLRRWAQTIEDLGFDLLMVSDHIAVTPDVGSQYPAPFYEPFTTLSWLAGVTNRVRLGTTVLIIPYRHPLLLARMAANLNQLSGGRLILGVGVGWARQEFDALGVPFSQRGKLTDEYLDLMRSAWADTNDYGVGRIPIWVGGNSDAALRRARRIGDAWHPIRFTPQWIAATFTRSPERTRPNLAPRIALRLTESPIIAADRLAGEGTIDQVMDDLANLGHLGAETVVLDPFNGNPQETCHPETAWKALAMVSGRVDVSRKGQS